jgi:hypothetical protein
MKPDWLDQLAPPHAPPPPGWWPPAPGWWGLALLLLAALCAWAWWWCRPHRRQRRAALRSLRQLQAAQLDDVQLARALQDLLRRYALARHGRETVAQLAGEAWLAFVHAHGGIGLEGAAGRALLLAAYAGEAGQAERSRWLAGVRGFIRGRT